MTAVQTLAEEASSRWGYHSDSPGLLCTAAGHLSQPYPATQARATSCPQVLALLPALGDTHYRGWGSWPWEDFICFP